MRVALVALALVAVAAMLPSCIASSSSYYPNRHLPDSNTTILAMQPLAYGGQFIVVLGRDGQLWRVYQKNDAAMSWVDWAPLTQACPWKNDTKRTCVFDADPTIGRNSDGRLEIFIRFHNNLDLWQMYMTDPMDPESWTTPREPSCVDQDQKTGLWACLCPPVDKFLRCSYPNPNYWVGSPVFPTSDITVQNSIIDGRLILFFRGFDGRIYMMQQVNGGDSTLYTSPQVFSQIIFE